MGDDVNPYFDAKESRSTQTQQQLQQQIVVVDDGTRYIYLGNNSGGFVSVKDENRKGLISICGYTKIKLKKRTDDRIYFDILDTMLSGQGSQYASINRPSAPTYIKKMSRKNTLVLKLKDSKTSTKKHSTVKNATFDQELGTLDYGGATPCTVTLRTNSILNKIAAGTYKVRRPDYEHPEDYTAQYRIKNQKCWDRAWFPIEYMDNSQYIHLGNVSHGCVTIFNVSDWINVYHALIQTRIDKEGLYCAMIIVS